MLCNSRQCGQSRIAWLSIMAWCSKAGRSLSTAVSPFCRHFISEIAACVPCGPPVWTPEIPGGSYRTAHPRSPVAGGKNPFGAGAISLKAIESDEYLADHLASPGITIGLRSGSILDTWSLIGRNRRGQKSAWGYLCGVLPSNAIRHQRVGLLRVVELPDSGMPHT